MFHRLFVSPGGWRRAALCVAVACLAVLPLGRGSAPALAADDMCPEPNSAYQQSCLLPPNAPASSFLTSPDDADYFRIEVLDFGVTVNLQMVDAPRPYRMTIQNWEGKPVASTKSLPNDDVERSVQFKPAAPGSYYVLVDALYDGPDDVSPAEPYRILYKPEYPGPIPRIAYAADFRQPALEFSGTREWGTYSTKDSRYQVEMLKRGTGNEAAVAVAWWGEEYTDFTAATDVKLTVPGQQAGFAIGFRGHAHDAGETLRPDQVDLESAYLLLANTAKLEVALLRMQNDKPELLVPWMAVKSMRPGDQINHVVVRSTGATHIVNVNGEEVIKLNDPGLAGGKLILGALSFGDPVTVIYDNLLVTTPP
ncbi:MAG: hypothetical protein U0893_13790 [Chloroflexota bacterium]